MPHLRLRAANLFPFLFGLERRLVEFRRGAARWGSVFRFVVRESK
jgi:hypothetical protein